MPKIKPLSNYVFLKAIEEEQKTKSGIIIPDAAEKERPVQGEVIAVGPATKSVEPGQLVLFKKYSPDDIELDGDSYLIAEENDIMAVLETNGKK